MTTPWDVGTQAGNAQIVTETVLAQGLDVAAAVIAVMVILDETSGLNLNFGDVNAATGLMTTSRGLFQQKQEWGPLADRLDPVKATLMFLNGGASGQPGLLTITGDWRSMPPWVAAQAVQGSQFGDGLNYKPYFDLATQLVTQFAPPAQKGPTVLTENGFTADSPVVTAIRPAYGYRADDTERHFNAGSINVKAGVVHSVECRLADMMAGPAGSDGGLLGDDWMDKQTTQASVHYGTDPDDTVQGVKEKDGCWGAGPNANAVGIHCEQTGQAAMSRADWTTPDGLRQLHRTAALFADVFTRHNIPFQWATDQQIQDAVLGGPACGLTYHEDWTRNFPNDTTHTDPGSGFPGKPIGPFVPGQTDLSGDLLLPLMIQYATGAVSGPPTAPPPPVPTDWFDMATETNLHDVVAANNAALLAQMTTLVQSQVAAAIAGAPCTALLFKNSNGGIGIADLASKTWRGIGSPQELAVMAHVPRHQNLAAQTAAQVSSLFGKQVG